MKLVILFLLSFLFLAEQSYASPCEGRVFNPVTDMNWNNSFPIKVGGQTLPGGSGPNNPPLHNMPAVCNCTGLPGVGITFWEPRFVAEVSRTAGCLNTLGGVDILGSNSKYLSSEALSDDMDEPSQRRMQVHWYSYPAAQMLDVLSSWGSCVSMPEFGLDTPTEVDPLWNSELSGSLNAPEGLLFANPIAALSCSAEAATTMFNYNLDLLYWCAGSQGVVYPLFGRGQNHTTATSGNLHILGKYMARKHKEGGLLGTIGPGAQCSPIYSPVWIKSQYRFDLIYPVAKNSTIVMGKPDISWSTNATRPTETGNAYMIWRARQCCFIPY